MVSSCIQFTSKKKKKECCSFYGWRVFHNVCTPYFLYPVSWWTSWLIPYLNYCELSCYEAWEYRQFYMLVSFLLHKFPRVGMLSHMADLFSHLLGISTLSSIMVVLVYIPQNRGLGYLFPPHSCQHVLLLISVWLYSIFFMLL